MIITLYVNLINQTKIINKLFTIEGRKHNKLCKPKLLKESTFPHLKKKKMNYSLAGIL